MLPPARGSPVLAGRMGAGSAGRRAARLRAVAGPVMPRPSRPRGPGQAQHAQPGQVDRGGQQVEVGGDLGKAADPYPAAAVAAADQMGQFPLDLGSGRAVVGGTIRVGLAGAGSRQLVLVGGDGDGAASLRAGAPASKRAARAGGAEAGLAVVTVAWG